MSEATLVGLVTVAGNIVQLEANEAEHKAQGQWKKAKQLYEAQVEEFNRLKKRYVDGLLTGDADRNDVVDATAAELEGIRSSSDPAWHGAVDYASAQLVPYLRKEAAKSPTYRKAVKCVPYAAGAIALAIYFGVRLYYATPISEPIASKAGLIQRAAATGKALQYDDLMDTHVRKGGWLKGILFWPVEPTEGELKGASEFVAVALEAQKLTAQKSGCVSLVEDGNGGLSLEQVAYLKKASEYMVGKTTHWQEPPLKTILDAAAVAGSCGVQ